jgi:hypothetical protein
METWRMDAEALRAPESNENVYHYHLRGPPLSTTQATDPQFVSHTFFDIENPKKLIGLFARQPLTFGSRRLLSRSSLEK